MTSFRRVLIGRGIVTGLVVSMLMFALPTTARAQIGVVPAPTEPAIAPGDRPSALDPVPAPSGLCPGCRELPEARTGSSRTYVDRRGASHVLVLPDDVHYRSGSDWLPMDNRLEAATGGGWRNRANAYAATLPTNLSAPVRVDHGGRWLSFGLEGADAPGLVAGDTVTYAGALAGVEGPWPW